MRKVVVFSSANKSREINDTDSNVKYYFYHAGIIAAAAAISFLVASKSNINILPDPGTELLPLILLILATLLLVWVLMGACAIQTKSKQSEYWVCIYPMGIQVSQVCAASRSGHSREDPSGIDLGSSSSNNNGIVTTLIMFVPRDEILDCVVNEQLLAHRVRNCLLLRLKNRRRLVEPFPTLDLTYMECLKVRNEIMQGLYEYGMAVYNKPVGANETTGQS